MKYSDSAIREFGSCAYQNKTKNSSQLFCFRITVSNAARWLTIISDIKNANSWIPKKSTTEHKKWKKNDDFLPRPLVLPAPRPTRLSKSSLHSYNCASDGDVDCEVDGCWRSM